MQSKLEKFGVSPKYCWFIFHTMLPFTRQLIILYILIRCRVIDRIVWIFSCIVHVPNFASLIKFLILCFCSNITHPNFILVRSTKRKKPTTWWLSQFNWEYDHWIIRNLYSTNSMTYIWFVNRKLIIISYISISTDWRKRNNRKQNTHNIGWSATAIAATKLLSYFWLVSFLILIVDKKCQAHPVWVNSDDNKIEKITERKINYPNTWCCARSDEHEHIFVIKQQKCNACEGKSQSLKCILKQK